MTDALKLKVLPTFPTRVVGEGGVIVTKTNGVWTISLDVDEVQETVGLDVQGTANRITVVEDGFDNPTVDIASTYVGQTSITTVGTLTTGATGGAFVTNYTVGLTDAEERSLASRMADEVSVIDFGADPTGASDDTDAFQAAIDSGKPVYVPPGTYGVSSLTILTDGVSIRGGGRARTRIFKTASSGDMITIGNNVLGTGEQVTICDLDLYGQFATGGNIITTKGVEWFKLRDCTLYGAYNHAVELGGLSFATGEFTTATITGCLINGPRNKNGIYCNNWWQDVFIDNCTVSGGPDNSTYGGIYVYGTGSISISGCNIYTICNRMVLDNASWGCITGCFFTTDAESAARSHILVNSGKGHSISGCAFYIGAHTATNAISLVDTSYNSVTGGTIDAVGVTCTTAISETGTSDFNHISGFTFSGTHTNKVTKAGASTECVYAPWTSWTPTITAGGGTLTGHTVTPSCKYQLNGRNLKVRGRVTVTAVGSGSPISYLILTLPLSITAGSFNTGGGTLANTGGGVTATASGGGTIAFTKADGNHLWTNGNLVDFYAEIEF